MLAPATEAKWPRLLYIGDVPVEATFHGSALLFRLLQRYPVERLTVVEGNIFRGPCETTKLPGVTYHTLTVGNRRLLNSRLHDIYSSWLFTRRRSRLKSARAAVGDFLPDAVLTIAHGYSWLTAADYASASNRPLHLIVHDDVPRSTTVEREFARVFQQAASRLCVSPAMVEEYERRYGARATLLLPGRAVDAETFEQAAERTRTPGATFVVAFAGSINSPGYVRLLRRLATSLARVSGELLIYGPINPDHAAAAGLSLPNIRLAGLIPSAELLRRLRADADVLFVPMSFSPNETSNMKLSFPSKLTDYTAAGLPLLIWGPPDCSAARWALDHPGVAALVTSDDQLEIDTMIDRLIGSIEYRRALAAEAQSIGAQDFSAEAVESVFLGALRAS